MKLDPPRQALMDAVGKSTYSLRDLSLKLGKNHAYLQQYVERGSPAKLAEDDREELAALLKIDPSSLRPITGDKKVAPASLRQQNDSAASQVPGLNESSPEAFPLRSSDIEPSFAGARDLPVYGAAEGGGGVMILDSEPIEYAPRPATLIGVRGAFAVYVVNNSMAPAYEQGDRVHVHPGRPVTPNKDAVFLREDPDGTRHAMVKRLVRATDKAWKVKQFNPEKTFDLPRAQWQKAQRIVGSDRAD